MKKNDLSNNTLTHHFSSRYSRELNPDQVTHLVVVEASGLKYETAIQYGDRISVVSPAWIEACVSHHARADEQKFMFASDMGRKLQDILDKNEDSKLFSTCFFHLMGWDVTDSEYRSLSLVIRRCWGTILWDRSDEAITHVIAKDGVLEESTRYVLLSISIEHC